MAKQDVIAKLRIEKYERRLMLNRPESVTDLASLAFDTESNGQPYHLVMEFVFSLEEMAAAVHRVEQQNLLIEDGLMYLVYPKKGNSVYPQYIGRDDIFPRLQVSNETGIVDGTNLKFNLMAAFNDTFTVVGLKRLGAKSRKAAEADTESQSSALYADRIDELEHRLLPQSEALAFFRSLTPGYQKDWARYVFSAKSEATKEKHLQEMIDLLQQGYKSINLYRQSRNS